MALPSLMKKSNNKWKLYWCHPPQTLLSISGIIGVSLPVDPYAQKLSYLITDSDFYMNMFKIWECLSWIFINKCNNCIPMYKLVWSTSTHCFLIRFLRPTFIHLLLDACVYQTIEKGSFWEHGKTSHFFLDHIFTRKISVSKFFRK